MENLDLQQLEWLFYALLGLILLVVVALIVYVVVANQRRGRMVRAREEAQTNSLQPTTERSRGKITLVRGQHGEALMVEVGGIRYGRLLDIKEPELRQEVLAAAVDLVRFTGVLDEEVLSPAPPVRAIRRRQNTQTEASRPPEGAQNRMVSEGAQATAQAEPEGDEARFLRSLSEAGSDSTSLAPPTLLRSIRQRMQAKQQDIDLSPSFVADIDRIVQRRLQLIPALAGRELRVRLTVDGMVRFWFEGQDYENLDDVPNLTARQLLRDAIQEWDETT